jgi:hypothetical protein
MLKINHGARQIRRGADEHRLRVAAFDDYLGNVR